MANDDQRRQAAREVLFCETILRKTGDTVLLDVLRGAGEMTVWQHYPPGDVFDAESGAQWYYHAHAEPGTSGEHGHFHCFIRPDGREGPIHHLVAVGVDPHGRLLRLFTINQWVVGDTWLSAEETIELLPRFDVQLGRPSYLANRWVTGILRLYEPEIAELIRKRDKRIDTWRPETSADAVRQDRALEVTSELTVDLHETTRSLLVG